MANQNNKRQFKVPDDTTLFASLTFKKYKKKYSDPYASKKDQKKGYYRMLLDLLPRTIDVLVKYSQVPDIREIKSSIYDKLFDKAFIKLLTKELKEDVEYIENSELLPIIIYDLITEANKRHAEELKENPEAAEFDLSDVIELSSIINKKKMKKLKKGGVPETVAFDILSVIPTSKALEKSQTYRIRTLCRVLYEHAKNEEFTIDPIMKLVIKSDYHPAVITFLLLEKKEIYVNYTEKQKEFFNKVTDWCFNTLEDCPKETINSVLRTYIKTRQNDKAQNRDSNRRFFLSSLPEDQFPKIVKVMNKIIEQDESVKEFL